MNKLRKRTLKIGSIACLVWLLSSSYGSGQELSKEFMVGGSFGFSHTTEENSNNNQTSITLFSVRPSVSYFINNKLIVGSGVGFRYQRNIDTDDIKTNWTMFQLSPFARYFVSLGEKVNLFAEGYCVIGFGGTKVILEDAELDTGDTQVFAGGLSSGVNYFVTDRLWLELGFGVVGFSSVNTKNPTAEIEDKANYFDFDFSSFTPNLGIYYLF